MEPRIGLAVVGAGYWGPNLVRTALATPAFGWTGCAISKSNGPAPSSARTRQCGPPSSYDAVLAIRGSRP